MPAPPRLPPAWETGDKQLLVQNLWPESVVRQLLSFSILFSQHDESWRPGERDPSLGSRSAPQGAGHPPRHGTPWHCQELKAEGGEGLGVSAQVGREERVLQSPRAAGPGAEGAGAKAELVCLAPAAAGADVGPCRGCGGGDGDAVRGLIRGGAGGQHPAHPGGGVPRGRGTPRGAQPLPFSIPQPAN